MGYKLIFCLGGWTWTQLRDVEDMFLFTDPHRVDEVNGQGQGAAGPVYRCGVSMNLNGVQPLLVAYYTWGFPYNLNGGIIKMDGL